MKTLRTFMLTLIATTLITGSAYATYEQSPSTPVVREINNISFKSLEISSNFTVKLTPSEKCKVKIKVSKSLVPNLISKVVGDKLILAINSNKFRSKEATVEISAPSFKELDLNGNVNMTIEGDWELQTVRLNLSGAAKLTTQTHKLNINQLNICQSGGSHLHAALRVKNLNIDNSGASHLTLQNLNHESGHLVNLDASGNSQINLSKLSFEIINVDASGTANAFVFPVKNLNVNASGNSSVRYIGSSKELNTNFSTCGTASITLY